jgi:FkbM family methyltransferase
MSASHSVRVVSAVAAGSAWSPSFTSEPIVSYSQNAEDVRLWRVLRTVDNGFYVDVGAADPDVDSVTRLFYERGWSGVNIEPSPCFAALEEARPRDVNLPVAIGEREESVPFFLTYPFLGTSTVDLSVHGNIEEAIERVEETAVPQRRLESVLREHAADRTIHFLKVDVEGAERQVLASSDWDAFRPVVVVVEAVESWSTTPTHERWEGILTGAGYRFAAFDGVNRFYVAEGYDHLIPSLAYPISALDRFVPAPLRDSEARLDHALQELEERATETESLRASLDRTVSERDEARRALDVVHGSLTWRAGRVLATAARPFRSLSRRLRSLGRL